MRFFTPGLFFWTLGYDTIYAHQDKEDDALIGVKSTARLLMQDSGKWILRFYAVCFTLVLAAGFAEHAGWPFAFVMLAAGAHLLWQVRRLKINDAANCLMLFRANSVTRRLDRARAFAAAPGCALVRMNADAFIRDNSELLAPPLVPEIRLHLASEVLPLWRKTEEELAEIGVPPPYWAFAWAGGQALARYVLDHPGHRGGQAGAGFRRRLRAGGDGGGESGRRAM